LGRQQFLGKLVRDGTPVAVRDVLLVKECGWVWKPRSTAWQPTNYTGEPVTLNFPAGLVSDISTVL
jgi:hypothetical protein